jgi:hypothetical protein
MVNFAWNLKIWKYIDLAKNFVNPFESIKTQCINHLAWYMPYILSHICDFVQIFQISKFGNNFHAVAVTDPIAVFLSNMSI